ncbi:SH3 domain [Carpediemonas membranifera]|uniref:SH3 domain n=1 Tax=Carpediemonas membranifera TaxID=201153 RepID=A0A8J6ASH9_9EUKA|nr:SH3 domain [Carpediemonas membranifera]|eukprot:KAG9390375.1 SH3 domain [Carpediemonas membranifera]
MAEQNVAAQIQALLSTLEGDQLAAALAQLQMAKPETPAVVTPAKGVHLCPQHSKELDVYDYDEKKIVCHMCALFSSAGHEIITLKEALARSIPDLEEQTHIHEQQLKDLVKRKDLTQRLRAEAAATHASSYDAVQAHFEDLRNTINAREIALLEQLKVDADKKDAHYDDVLGRLSKDIQRSEAAIKERKAKLATSDPFQILDMRTVHDSLRTEIADAVDTVHPQADGSLVVALPPTVKTMLEQHGSSEYHRSVAVLEEQKSFETLTLADFRYICDDVISKRRVTMQQMLSIIGTRIEINNDIRRDLTKLKSCSSPDEGALMRSLWNTVIAEHAETNKAIIDSDHTTKETVVKALNAARDAVPRQVDQVNRVVEGTVRTFQSFVTGIKKSVADVQAQEAKVKKLQFDHNAGRNVDKKLKSAHEKYLKVLEAYREKQTEYQTARGQLDAVLASQLKELEATELTRIVEVRNALQTYVATRSVELRAQDAYLAKISDRIAALEPKYVISQIAAMSQRKATPVDGFEVDIPEFPASLMEDDQTNPLAGLPKPATPAQPQFKGKKEEKKEKKDKSEPVQYGLALYAYSKQDQDEADIEEGQYVRIVSVDPNGWASIVNMHTDEMGNVPYNYLDVMSEEAYLAACHAAQEGEEPAVEAHAEPEPEQAPASLASAAAATAKPVSAAKADPDRADPAQEGQTRPGGMNPVAAMLAARLQGKAAEEESDDDWDSETSPEQDTAESKPASTVPNAIMRVEAQFDYEKSDDDEIDMAKGDFLSVTQVASEDWYIGLNERTGKTGMFPSNFVHKVEC